MRYNTLKQQKQTSQKKRYKNKYKYINTNNSIISLKSGRFEYIYFFQVKRLLKKLLTKNNIVVSRRRIIFFCTSNYPISKKSKNSRMGSGKGDFLRWTIRVNKNSTLIKTYNIPAIILKRIVKLWNFKLPFKVFFNSCRFC